MSKTTDSILKWGGVAFIVYLASDWLVDRVSSKLSYGRPRIILGGFVYPDPGSVPGILSNVPIGVDATVEIPVTNNNTVSFPVDRLLANVVYGPYVMASLVIDNPVVIEAGETTVLQFDAPLDFANVGGNIAALITSGEFLQSLRITGSITVAGVTGRYDEPITIG